MESFEESETDQKDVDWLDAQPITPVKVGTIQEVCKIHGLEVPKDLLTWSNGKGRRWLEWFEKTYPGLEEIEEIYRLRNLVGEAMPVDVLHWTREQAQEELVRLHGKTNRLAREEAKPGTPSPD